MTGETEGDKKWEATEDTKWEKHGFNASASVYSDWISALLEQEDDGGDASIELLHHRDNEVLISMRYFAPRDRTIEVTLSLRPDQADALAEALREQAGAARQDCQGGSR